MSTELQTDDNREIVETLHDSLIHHDDVTRRNDDTQPKVACGTVDELCTCVGFLTCQDPENYDVDDDDIIEVTRPILTPVSTNVTLPDPPQPDPPESHTVLVQRTRHNVDDESTTFDDGESSRPPMESFDVIVHTPSQQPLFSEETILVDEEQYSTVTATTTSTARRKKPEEYEPLILIVDDEEEPPVDIDHAPLVSPTSNCAVRDSSSTSSLQYHRRSPMFLSYASPQQEISHNHRDRRKESNNHNSHNKKRHDMFQSLLDYEISKRNGRSVPNTANAGGSRSNAYSIQYNRYSTSKNHQRSMEDTIRRYSHTIHNTNTSTNNSNNSKHKYNKKKDTMDRVGSYRYQNAYPDTSTIATSTVASEMDLYDPSVTAAIITNTKRNIEDLNDTDTVRAVAPDKDMMIHGHSNRHHTTMDRVNDDDDDRHDIHLSNHHHHHQVIVVVPHSNCTKLS